MKARGHTILLIDPPECSFSVESLLRYAHLVVGASHSLDVKEEDPTDVEEDSSKIIDFLGKTIIPDCFVLDFIRI